jgi:hypothetical protein
LAHRPLSPEHRAAGQIYWDTPLGQQIVSFKVWDPTGKVVYSTDDTIGQTFPISDGLATAIWGQVSSEISQLEAEENVAQRAIRSELLETYSPVRLSGTDEVIAVAEFYQTVDALNQEIAAAQRRKLARRGRCDPGHLFAAGRLCPAASDTIEQQQATLNDQISRLTELLSQNQELHERVRRAAGSVATLNERSCAGLAPSCTTVCPGPGTGSAEAGCVDRSLGAGTDSACLRRRIDKHAIVAPECPQRDPRYIRRAESAATGRAFSPRNSDPGSPRS